MELMTVAQFAAELKMPAPALLEQLARAGVSKKAPADTVTEQDKSALLDFLRKSHGETAPKAKITLTRKQTSEIKATDSTGKARTVQVEVRKKRVFVKREHGEAADAPVAAPPVEPPPVLEAPAPVVIPEPVEAVALPTPEPVVDVIAPRPCHVRFRAPAASTRGRRGR